MVNGSDGRIGPVALGLRRKVEYDQARHQPAEPDHQREQSRPLHPSNDRAALTARTGRQIANDLAKEQMCRPVDREIEGDCSQASHKADARAEQQPLGEIATGLEA